MAALLSSSLCACASGGLARECVQVTSSRVGSTGRVILSRSGWRGGSSPSRRRLQCRAHTVEVLHGGKKHVLEVDEDESILSKALDAGLDLPYDCRLGVCMTCPAKLEQGKVDQSEGMLSDDVVDQGYTLMCVAYPRSDCTIRTIPEDELLSLQLVTSGD